MDNPCNLDDLMVEQEPDVAPDDSLVPTSISANKKIKTNNGAAVAVVHKKTQTTKHKKTTNKKTSSSPPVVKEETCNKILAELVTRGGRSNKGVSKKILAAAVGFQCLSSKGFREPLKALKDRGNVYVEKDKVFITDKGKSKVPGGDVQFETKWTNAEQIASYVETIKVPGYRRGCGEMMEALKDGAYHTRLEVANKMGCSRIDSSGFKNCYKAVRDNDLLEFNGEKGAKFAMRLVDDVFPEGRPCDKPGVVSWS